MEVLETGGDAAYLVRGKRAGYPMLERHLQDRDGLSLGGSRCTPSGFRPESNPRLAGGKRER